MTDAPSYTESCDLYEVIPYERKVLLEKNVTLSLYGDRLVATGQSETHLFPYESTLAITVLGRNKLNVYSDGKIYQIKSGKRFNALKYVHFYHRYKNIVKGDQNVKFLGL